ncbi:MAG: TIGR03960 family B12-binding radical SAM protein [Lachnospiraceae bacterium]|nr:TIGR03960 family B12-binding radical SAM protein [Lachnospiraceae bacterium]
MNQKLALPEEVLMSIEKPERYIGHEINAVFKDKDKIDIRFAMCFPDVYEIGMSHLGIQILYDMFNRFEDTWCERVYSPWVDLDKIMREKKLSLFTWESQDPVREMDFLGITLQYEMCYTNILQILDLSNIPLIATERTWEDPIVIGGGPCSYNPEPIADFFDLFYIGEGETRYRELLDLYKESRKNNESRDEFLYKAAKIPGMYVPRFYEPIYNEDFTLKEFRRLKDDIPATIVKELVTNLDDTYYPEKPIVPYMKVTQDRVVLEIMRGCIRGCRFCQAGQIYKPVRERSIEFLKERAETLLKNTGHEEISLSSLSSSDYSHIEELVNFLIEDCTKKKVNIALPSLRIDQFSVDVMEKVQDIKKSSLTFAPEAGSQRMRNIINKGLTEEDIINGAVLAFKGGWTKVKLYFMLGLPFEEEEDIEGIAKLCNNIAAAFYEAIPKEKRINGKVSITASTSFFIPKPFTPFQWAKMNTKEDFIDKAEHTKHYIMSQLNQKVIRYIWHEADVSMLEGVMARGDRRLSKVILMAYKKGCIYDAWSEYYKHDVWLECFKECGIDPFFYTTRERKDDELFPWDFLDCGVSKAHLLREWKKAQAAIVTDNCKKRCVGCGTAKFDCGLCINR